MFLGSSMTAIAYIKHTVELESHKPVTANYSFVALKTLTWVERGELAMRLETAEIN